MCGSREGKARGCWYPVADVCVKSAEGTKFEWSVAYSRYVTKSTKPAGLLSKLLGCVLDIARVGAMVQHDTSPEVKLVLPWSMKLEGADTERKVDETCGPCRT